MGSDVRITKGQSWNAKKNQALRAKDLNSYKNVFSLITMPLRGNFFLAFFWAGSWLSLPSLVSLQVFLDIGLLLGLGLGSSLAALLPISIGS